MPYGTNEEPRAGLHTQAGLVPLLGVDVESRVDGPTVEVTLRQRYRNSGDQAIEAQYVFPLDESAAVSGFRARVGEQTVVAVVKEREEAFEEYDDALAEGHAAFLMDQERDDVFTAWVGNLKAGEEAVIELRYVTKMRAEGPAFRFELPTTVAPRYAPAGSDARDVDAVNPERWFRVPYGLTLKVEIEGMGPLGALSSPSHPVSVRMEGEGATVELGQSSTAMDRDFVLVIEPKRPHQPVALLAEGDAGERFALLSFRPDLAEVDPPAAEVLFLLDCSGSMGGSNIDQAKRALALSIRSLGADDAFNIVRFGSSHQRVFSRSLKVTDANLKKAEKAIERIDADLGGTEILAPLEEMLKAKPQRERERYIVVLTDGQVSNEREVIKLVRRRRSATRIFSFAIGSAASQHLVRGLAREGKGESETIHPGERIEPKVLRTFGRMRSPRVTKLEMDWGDLKVTTARNALPPLFKGENLEVLARIEGGDAPSVSLLVDGERFEVELGQARGGSPIPALWARERLRTMEWDLEVPRSGSLRQRDRDSKARDALVGLSVKYGVLSSVTSFIGVIERQESETNDGPEKLVQVPLQLNSGWGGRMEIDGMVSSGAMSRACMDMAAPAPAAMASPMPKRRKSKSGGRGAGRAMAKEMFGGASGLFADEGAEAFEESAPAEEEDRLYQILLTQRADGAFGMTPTLEAWLGVRLDEARGSSDGADEESFFTSLLLDLLESDFADREGEWRAAAAKARRWLKSR